MLDEYKTIVTKVGTANRNGYEVGRLRTASY